MNRLPKIRSGRNIAIICEGYEEADYLARLIDCEVWNSAYNIRLYNAKSIDHIAAVYQSVYQNAVSDLVLVYCDTERTPYAKFNCLMRKINAFHAVDAAKSVIIFSNPCTMQIILSHFAPVKLVSNSKSENAPIIRALTGVSGYHAEEKQRRAIMRKITPENYARMKENIRHLDGEYTVVPCTNAVRFFDRLETPDSAWIDLINLALQ